MSSIRKCYILLCEQYHEEIVDKNSFGATEYRPKERDVQGLAIEWPISEEIGNQLVRNHEPFRVVYTATGKLAIKTVH